MLLETSIFSLEMHRTPTRLAQGMILAAMSFKADAAQCAVELLACPDIGGDGSEPSVSSAGGWDGDVRDDSDGVLWGAEPQ